MGIVSPRRGKTNAGNSRGKRPRANQVIGKTTDKNIRRRFALINKLSQCLLLVNKNQRLIERRRARIIYLNIDIERKLMKILVYFHSGFV